MEDKTKNIERAKRLASYRLLNPYFQSSRPELIAVVDTIVDLLVSSELVSRKSKELLPCCMALVINLYLNHLDDVLVGINLANGWFNKYKWNRNKEKSHTNTLPRYWKYSTVASLEKNLSTLGLLERCATGYKNPSDPQDSNITKIQGLDTLWQIFDQCNVAPYMLMKDLNQRSFADLAVLKGKRKRRITIPAKLNTQADTISKNIQKINDALARQVISLNITDDELSQLKERRFARRINPDKRDENNPHLDFIWMKSLYRVFHNDFKTHGRFYGGFWQSLPNKERWKDSDRNIQADGIQFRRKLEIDGEQTVEIDYSSMHPRLLYHKNRIEYLEDPYLAIVKSCPEINGKKVLREQAKLALNILINIGKTKDPVITIASAWNSDDSNETTIDHDFTRQLIEATKDTHKPIVKLFNATHANKLMFQDSQIAEQVMLTMIDQYQTIVLPVHDSFIVQKQYESDLQLVMEQSYQDIAIGSAKVKHTAPYPHKPSAFEEAMEKANSFHLPHSERMEILMGVKSPTSQSYRWRDMTAKQLTLARDEYIEQLAET